MRFRFLPYPKVAREEAPEVVTGLTLAGPVVAVVVELV